MTLGDLVVYTAIAADGARKNLDVDQSVELGQMEVAQVPQEAPSSARLDEILSKVSNTPILSNILCITRCYSLWCFGQRLSAAKSAQWQGLHCFSFCLPRESQSRN